MAQDAARTPVVPTGTAKKQIKHSASRPKFFYSLEVTQTRSHTASAGATDGGAATAAAASAHICLSAGVAAGAPPQHEDPPSAPARLSASRSSSSHLRSTSAVTRRPLKPGLLGPSPL